VAWASGESVFLVGPAGVGKTTLAQQLTLARAGLRTDVLGFPVVPDGRRVLYVAADRPQQAQRSFARMVSEADRETLTERLRVWRGPLEADLGARPHILLELCEKHDAGTVVLDSLKDVALELSKDETGSRVNNALQLTVAEGVDVVVLHHQRKATSAGTKPTTLSDVYGSTWLTAGAGSVILLWGEAGWPIVELSHLKQPAGDDRPVRRPARPPHWPECIYDQPNLVAFASRSVPRDHRAAGGRRALRQAWTQRRREGATPARGARGGGSARAAGGPERRRQRPCSEPVRRGRAVPSRGGLTCGYTCGKAITKQSRRAPPRNQSRTNHGNHAEGQKCWSGNHAPITSNHEQEQSRFPAGVAAGKAALKKVEKVTRPARAWTAQHVLTPIGHCVTAMTTCADNAFMALSPLLAAGLTGWGVVALVAACGTVIGCLVTGPMLGAAVIGGGWSTWQLVKTYWRPGASKHYAPLR
jgi:KaiC/GvpD/RAD55 family RecA-like ATPase